MEGSVNGDSRQQENGGCRCACAKPEGYPNQKGNAEKFQGEMLALSWQEPSEHNLADHKETKKHRRGFYPCSPPLPPGPRAPDNQQRGDHDGPPGTTEPPGQPDSNPLGTRC